MRRSNGGATQHHVDFCRTGKKKSSYAQAKKEARYLKNNKRVSGMVPVPYKCKHCGWWHVGNKFDD